MIKLPAGKYTVREREMLSGVAGAPESYFMPGNPFSNAIYGGEPPSYGIHTREMQTCRQSEEVREEGLPCNFTLYLCTSCISWEADIGGVEKRTHPC